MIYFVANQKKEKRRREKSLRLFLGYHIILKLGHMLFSLFQQALFVPFSGELCQLVPVAFLVDVVGDL